MGPEAAGAIPTLIRALEDECASKDEEVCGRGKVLNEHPATFLIEGCRADRTYSSQGTGSLGVTGYATALAAVCFPDGFGGGTLE